MKDINFYIHYDNEVYNFKFGSQAYIFHTGLYNGLDKRFGITELLNYVAVVQNCYLSDDNRTPLGSLCDHDAKHWNNIKNKSKYDILDEFYLTIQGK